MIAFNVKTSNRFHFEEAKAYAVENFARYVVVNDEEKTVEFVCPVARLTPFLEIFKNCTSIGPCGANVEVHLTTV
jgi:hypothetical protein